jgi:hypothetical protein
MLMGHIYSPPADGFCRLKNGFGAISAILIATPKEPIFADKPSFNFASAGSIQTRKAA